MKRIKKEKEEEYEKRNDKNQIWWSKLENYNIEDLGMNDAEKELFISSELITDEKNNLENNNNNENTNQNNNENTSLGQFINDNSLLKSNSKVEIENNNTNNNNEEINKMAKPIQLPPINLSRVIVKKEKEVNNKNRIS